MKVLQLCLRLPWPPNDGGTIAMFNMSEALVSNGVQVKVVAFNTLKHFVEPERIPSRYSETFQPQLVFLDATVKPMAAFLNLFSSESYNISRFDLPEMHQCISDLLQREQFDIIQLESLFMTPYVDTIRKFSKAKVILRAHNVEYIIWERLASSETNLLKKKYLQLLASRLKRFETGMLNRVDGIIVLTNEDRDTFMKCGCNVPVAVSPVSIDTGKYLLPDQKSNSQYVFHLGSMDWMPNIEGVEWFLQKVMPLVSDAGVDFKLFLAGKAMPEVYFEKKGKHLEITGKVDDAREFMSDKQIMIVPLLSGGGMRVKIIEGLAMGKTIVSTSIGAEGIKYTNGENILIADTPEQFAGSLLKCLSDADFCRIVGRNAQKLAAEKYDNKVAGFQVTEFYKSVLTETNYHN